MEGWRKEEEDVTTQEEKEEEEEQIKEENSGSCLRSQHSQEQQEGAGEAERRTNTHNPDILEQPLGKWMDKEENDPCEQRRGKRNKPRKKITEDAEEVNEVRST